ncbi:MAG: hypothetical protein ACREJQ_03675 [bacterium]
MLSLKEHLRKVVDSRSANGKVHQLHGVLCLVVIGLLTGQIGLSRLIAFAMGQGAQRRYNGENHRRMRRKKMVEVRPASWLYEIGLLWRGAPTVPGLQTLIRILGGIKPGELQEAMGAWVKQLLEELGAQTLVGSVDGKAMKAAGRHVLSVFIHDLQQVLWQEEVGEKKNELSAFRDRLKEMLARYPGLWLICGDAMFADQTLCDLLKREGRQWMFQIKANQPNLMEKIEIIFSPIVRQRPHLSDEPEKKRTAW